MSKAYDIVMSNRKEIVDKLIAQMEKGYAATRAAWNKSAAGRSYNPVSKAVYRGGNRFRLMIAAEENGFTDPRWMTFKQASENNYKIAAGAKGVLLEKWIFHKDVPKLDENGNPVIGADGNPEIERVKLSRPIVNYFRVFNGEQIIGLPELERKELTEDYYSKTAEVFEHSSKCPISYERQDRAYYSSSEDKIHLPPKESFKNNETRLSILLHEMAHSTGHESRLNRPIKNQFGSIEYAKEELNAELSSVFLENELGIQMDADSEMLKDHSNYVKSWISVLKNDPNELFIACANAEEITEFLMKDYEKQLDISIETSEKNMEQDVVTATNIQLVDAMELIGYQQIDTGDGKISFQRIDDNMNYGDTGGWTFQYDNWTEVRNSFDTPRLWEEQELTDKVNELINAWDGKKVVAIESTEDFAEPDKGFYTYHYSDGHEGVRYRLVELGDDGFLHNYLDNDKFFINRDHIQEYIDTHADEIKVIGYDEMVHTAGAKQLQLKLEQSLDPVAPDATVEKTVKVFEEKEITPEHQDRLNDILKHRSVKVPLDLTNKDFLGVRFTGNLEGIEFSKSRFINCVFENAHLSGNKMNGTSFHDCKLSYGYMESVDLSGASFYGAKFEHHEMSDNNLERAYLSNTVFNEDCVINDNNLLNARISHTRFWNEDKHWQLNLDTADIHIGGATTEECENYRKDVIEHLTEADVHADPRIRRELKEHGFKPTKTLVENIKQLEKFELRKLSLKDVARFAKTGNCFGENPMKQRYLDKIIAECKSQELDQARESPRNENFLKQEMMADMEVTQIG